MLWFDVATLLRIFFQTTDRDDFHGIYLSEGPVFSSDQFRIRYEYYQKHEEMLQEKKKKKIPITEREIKFRKRFGMNSYPISHGICNSIITPTWLHAMGHCGMLVCLLFRSLIDINDKGYAAFIKSLSMQFDFLENGDIISSTSAFLTMLQELRSCFLFIPTYTMNCKPFYVVFLL